MPQTKRRDGTDAMHHFGHARRAAAVTVTLAAALALAPAVAQATPALIVSTTLATPATVGETLTASLSLTNNSTADDPTLTICKVGDGGACANTDGIVLIPSCGQDSGTACAAADPDVLSINQTATGAASARE